MLHIHTKKGFGKLTPEAYLVKRVAEIVHPYRIRALVKGPKPVPLTIDDGEYAVEGYTVQIIGNLKNKPLLCIPVEKMEDIESNRVAAAVLGNIVLDQIATERKEKCSKLIVPSSLAR